LSGYRVVVAGIGILDVEFNARDDFPRSMRIDAVKKLAKNLGC
jgi:hypothetical protein